jgi:two-component system cell cycle response regulator
MPFLPASRRAAAALVFVTAALAACVAQLTLPLGASLEEFGTDWLYDSVVIAAGLVCITRGLTRSRERAPWILIGVAVLCWGIGDVIWTWAYDDLDSPPFPSIADGFWLAIYPPIYVAILLLLRSKVGSVRRSLWLDGVIGSLAVASIGTAIVFEAVLHATSGSKAAVATNLAYPLADLLLIALVVWVLGLSGWRVSSAWALLAAGLLVFSVSDCLYLFQTAVDSYSAGTATDIGWIVGCVLLAWAAWQPEQKRREFRVEGTVLLLAPVVFGLIALSVLVYDHFSQVNALTLVLATAASLAVIARMAMTFSENVRMLAGSRREARTDPLTGLGNRRKLLADLESALDDGANVMLALFDLNGFKQYNDTYGHPAGDALLVRLGANLDRFVGGWGTAYRMGGDEFCVVSTSLPAPIESLVESAAMALSDSGDGFEITAAHGAVLLPTGAQSVSEALRAADQRMYENKRGGRVSAGEQSSGVLLRALSERHPTLADHVNGVAELAEAVAAKLQLPKDEVARVRLAAALHDVGKMAIPDAILEKPGPLTSAEWEFLYRHTLVAERILHAAPDLAHVASIVRWSHERYDGNGYPDGLEGDNIPLTARIVFVCDAFDAMISERPYAAALTIDEALAELRRCAGTQFDPDVVDAFATVLEDRRSAMTEAEFATAIPPLQLVVGGSS